jgi:AAA family ATPase
VQRQITDAVREEYERWGKSAKSEPQASIKW